MTLDLVFSDLDVEMKEYDFNLLTDEEWESYFIHFEKISRERFPSYPLMDRDLRKQFLTVNDPNLTTHRMLIFDRTKPVINRCIGYAYIGYVHQKSNNYEANKHFAEIHITLDKEYRRKGIATGIFNLFGDFTRSLGRSRLMVWTVTDTGKLTCESFNGELTHKHYSNKSEIKELDWQMIDDWIEEGRKKAVGVTLERYNEIPEDDIEEYARVYTEVENQAPDGSSGRIAVTPEHIRIGEKRAKDIGTTITVIISREEDGVISGLTEIMYNPRESDKIQQELTGVLEKYRGRGLGKWLKAEMLVHIRSTYPDVTYISTGNAMENAPMLSINNRLGFKPQNVWHVYEFDL
ncbi:MAG: hypothetical protein OEZ01_00715 [Candidatus Heimdallarchaeota archaeon]|nr:hypothetical protein [Candidatus Heimdallarchaeota archaeon]MDH5644494.1 hypothetical protein [Candidatus Heimdallarchaeota archaeon]